jgi:hypothetical protein
MAGGRGGAGAAGAAGAGGAGGAGGGDVAATGGGFGGAGAGDVSGGAGARWAAAGVEGCALAAPAGAFTGNTLLQTAQRARTPPAGTLPGSTRYTVSHDGQMTFI